MDPPVVRTSEEDDFEADAIDLAWEALVADGAEETHDSGAEEETAAEEPPPAKRARMEDHPPKGAGRA